MKQSISILLLLFSNILLSQVALKDVLLINASSNGTWELTSNPTGGDISSLLIGDNPSIDFSTYPYGPYDFKYTVCSVARPDICKNTETSFYHMDVGEIDPLATDGCVEYDSIVLSETYNIFRLGSNASYTWDIPNALTINDNGTTNDLTDDFIDLTINPQGTYAISIICTPINPDPTKYTLDPNCIPKTYTFDLTILECCSQTVFAPTVLCN